MQIKTTEFFMNMKVLPPKDSVEFYQLIDWEREKIAGGVTVNGIKIPGWLYWHLNHWHIGLDIEDHNNNIVKKVLRPDLRDNEWIRAEYLERCRLEKKGYMEIGGRQGGKALLNSSLLYTPKGEITIGDCNVGDKVYDESGKLTTILAKYPQGVRPVYKITLIDGREVYCDLNHKWKVKDRFKHISSVKTTEELLKDYKRIRPSWIGKRKNHFEYTYSLPRNEAVEYKETEQILEPYFLGLWLGDGTSRSTGITSVDQEIIDYVYDYANRVGLKVTISDLDTFILTTGIQGGNKEEKKTRNFIHQYLKRLYLNKHIPNEYMYGSIEQRMELLKGLLDSDGSCDKTGDIEFSSTIPQLSEDFYKLCRGLGINLSKKICKTSYKKEGVKIECKDSTRFKLYTDKKVFKLSRKLERQFTVPKYLNNTAIIDIQYVYDAETTCIVVDNESHLFLTDNYTVTHNSEMEASFSAMNAIMFSESQNVIVGSNDNDISLLKGKLDLGLKHLWEGISVPRLDKTWRGNQIRLGIKFPNGDDDIWSTIIIRNTADGKNTEAAAGTTAKSFIMDEVGKAPFSAAFEAAKPAFVSQFGWRTVPILVGTGGSFDKGDDAERFFNNPEANNFLAVVDKETDKKTCIFLSGLYRQDCKREMNLADYLESRDIELDETDELRKIRIRVTDEELARKTILEERETKKKDPDQTEYYKSIMYFPLTPAECFMSVSNNIFNTRAATAQQQRVYDNNILGTTVFLTHDGTKIVHEYVDKRPITNFPFKHTDDLDAPIVMWEPPIMNAPYGLYVAGVDPYRHDSAAFSDSLGSVYIYKRMHDLVSEKYQDTFVAVYSARPDSKEKWQEQARLLIKYYNARTLVENDEMSFIEYMKAKGDSRYLERQPEWLKEIVPTSKVTREFGIHRSANKIIRYLHGVLKTYLEEKITEDEFDEEGSMTTPGLMGVYQVRDPMLLEEIIKFNEEGNFDRIVAAELALALAKHLDPLIKVSDNSAIDMAQKLKKTRKSTGIFANIRNTYAPKGGRLF